MQVRSNIYKDTVLIYLNCIDLFLFHLFALIIRERGSLSFAAQHTMSQKIDGEKYLFEYIEAYMTIHSGQETG